MTHIYVVPCLGMHTHVDGRNFLYACTHGGALGTKK